MPNIATVAQKASFLFCTWCGGTKAWPIVARAVIGGKKSKLEFYPEGKEVRRSDTIIFSFGLSIVVGSGKISVDWIGQKKGKNPTRR